MADNRRQRMIQVLTNQARKQYEEREFQKACYNLSQVLEHDSGNVAALCLRAFCFMAMHMHQLAVMDAQLACECYTNATDFEVTAPGRAEAMYTLAEALRGLGSFGESLRAYEHACNLIPGNAKYEAGRERCLAAKAEAEKKGDDTERDIPRAKSNASEPSVKKQVRTPASTPRARRTGSTSASKAAVPSPHTWRHSHIMVDGHNAPRSPRAERETVVAPVLALPEEEEDIKPLGTTDIHTFAEGTELRSAAGAKLHSSPHLGLHNFRSTVRGAVGKEMRDLFNVALQTGDAHTAETRFVEALCVQEEVGGASASLTGARKR